MIDIHIPRSRRLCTHLRTMVEAGGPDGPARVFHDGKHCLTIRSIHAAACLTVREEPIARFVPYEPHPESTIGPRMSVLLAMAEVTRRIECRLRARRHTP
jgi:hypothetical protein